MLAKFKQLTSGGGNRILKEYRQQVVKINDLENKWKSLTEADFKVETDRFKQELSAGKTLEELKLEAFALVREASKRVLGQRHYDVQLIGGLVLDSGKIAEMKTGEGKTLAATTAIYLNALSGKGVHLITVNDYLARRDAAWMGQVFNVLGLSTACLQALGGAFLYSSTIDQDLSDNDQEDIKNFKVDVDNLVTTTRKEAYQADITYGTNSEFGFDYLRDNMVYQASEKVQRGLNFAIIDEVDSILIDEARTPLIISAPTTKSESYYLRLAQIIPQLKLEQDYELNEKKKSVVLTNLGVDKVEKMLNIESLYLSESSLVHYLNQALKAEVLFKKDRDYVVKDGEIVIVDEFTGRLQFGRRYSQGLHQAIEAKEKVAIQEESKTLATITIQNYFRLYQKIAGMTGTAITEVEEFQKIYYLEVVVIPTNKVLARLDKDDQIYQTEAGKQQAIVRKVKELQAKGQPVLLGTTSISKNEIYSQLLTKAGIKHNTLNAKNHAKEAEFIAQAGKKGVVTVATNMAGRGVDIVLGGNPHTEAEQAEILKLGGLAVLGTERHEARRIDNQLRGRSGRQGDAGFSQFYLSMDDDLMRVFGSDRMKRMMVKLGLPEDMPIKNKLISKSIESAQKKVEGNNFDIRKHLVQYDDVINKQRTVIYKLRSSFLEELKISELESLILEVYRRQVPRILEEADLNKIQLILPQATEDNLKSIDLDQILKHISQEFNRYFAELEPIFQAENINQDVENSATKTEPNMAEVSFVNLTRNIVLNSIDTLWTDHLEELSHLKNIVGLRGYGQRDPILEYKKESFLLFQRLLKLVDLQVIEVLFSTMNQKLVKHNTSAQKALNFFKEFNLEEGGTKNDSAVSTKTTLKNPTTGRKLGRNDLCPCGQTKIKKCSCPLALDWRK